MRWEDHLATTSVNVVRWREGFIGAVRGLWRAVGGWAVVQAMNACAVAVINENKSKM